MKVHSSSLAERPHISILYAHKQLWASVLWTHRLFGISTSNPPIR